MTKYGLILINIFLSFSLLANDTCSRVAIINYQEVLVDINSTEKGVGLRNYLEKDKVAEEYLNKYQEGTGLRWQNAALGTLGVGLIIGGIASGSNNTERRDTMLVAGATTMLINFLVARTLDITNERNLNRAIEEYNKRNMPKIYYRPINKENAYAPLETGNEFGIVKSWSF